MTWNELISIYSSGSITYKFTTTNRCTVRFFTKLSDADYSGIAFVKLLGNSDLSIAGDGSAFSLMLGSSTLMSNISIAKNTWVDIVMVINDYSISLYLDGALISAATMSGLFNFTGITLYGVNSTVFDDLIYIRHTVDSTKVQYWARQTEEPIAADTGEAAYQIQIISQQGTTFRMGDDFSTTLEVRVWQGGEEITDEFTDEDFRWRRTSNDTYSDSVWNSAHYSTGGKTLTITQDDAVGRSNFFCDLLTKRS